MSNAEKQRRSANAVGGMTGRACDGCTRRRARWYCAADDAFLCQPCDSSVHSANLLARRHRRLRLKTSTAAALPALKPLDSTPAWHQGFKRKVRTPRPHHHAKSTLPFAPADAAKFEPLVPDLEASGEDNGTEEEQLLYRVPIFDPALAEFCSPPPLQDTNTPTEEVKPASLMLELSHFSTATVDGFAGFHPSEMEMEEFAADVESLLGRGLDDDTFCIEALGLGDSREGDARCCSADMGRVKTELDGESAGGSASQVGMEAELPRETLDIDFDFCGSPVEAAEDRKEEGDTSAADGCGSTDGFSLRLDYDGVIAAWSGSPWTDGERPQLSPNYMGMWGGGGDGGEVVRGSGVDGGREARVTRYREKRRTRLFSKKIRYEVRKLNAEKRPRMKGRFVKRTSFPPPTVPGFPY